MEATADKEPEEVANAAAPGLLASKEEAVAQEVPAKTSGFPSLSSAVWSRPGRSPSWRTSSDSPSPSRVLRFNSLVEYQIVDFLLSKDGKSTLKEEPLSIGPVQKQTCAGQRTRFKAYVVIGDFNSHIGLGWKAAKEVQGAIKGAVINAKLNIVPVRKGYWGNKINKPHTVPCKVTGKEGSVRVRLVPAPRGTGIVAAATSKKVLQMAGIQDCYTQSKGSTRTRSNFLKATFHALAETYRFLTPDLWGEYKIERTPADEHSEFLHTGAKKQ